jgi:hypothetical protein
MHASKLIYEWKGWPEWKKQKNDVNNEWWKRGTAMEFIMDKKVEGFLLNIKFKIPPMSRIVKKFRKTADVLNFRSVVVCDQTPQAISQIFQSSIYCVILKIKFVSTCRTHLYLCVFLMRKKRDEEINCWLGFLIAD